MVSVSIAVEESFKERVESFAWVTWSEVAREEAIKRKYLKSLLKPERFPLMTRNSAMKLTGILWMSFH